MTRPSLVPMLALALALGPLLTPAAGAQEPLDAETIAAAGREAARAVAGATGRQLDERVRFEPIESGALEEILRRELRPQAARQMEDEVEAHRMADRMAAVMSRGLLAKYSTADRRILVCPETIERHARSIDEPELRSPDALRALLVHEVVHALDHAEHDWPAVLDRIDTSDGFHAYNAVLEGHAQFVAREVCRAAGWADGFDVATRAIGKMPPDADEATLLVARVASANLVASYHDGERFIRALADSGDAGAVARAFAEPPADLEVIFHPRWFLEPDVRPERRRDLAAAIEAFVEGAGPDWDATHRTLTRPEVRAALASLDAATVDRIVETLVDTRMVVLQAGGGQRMVIAAVHEFAAADDALHYVAASERLSRLKDERMTEGPIEIVEATYEAVDRPAWQGIASRKHLRVQGQELAVETIVGRRGALAVELVHSNLEMPIDRMIEAAGDLLAAAAGE